MFGLAFSGAYLGYLFMHNILKPHFFVVVITSLISTFSKLANRNAYSKAEEGFFFKINQALSGSILLSQTCQK